VTASNNGCSANSQVIVVVNPTPTISLNCPALCAGIASDITATPSPAGTYTYNWTLPGGVTNPGNNSTVNTSTAGMYTVIATNTATNCASEATSCTIAVQNPPSINAISPP
jgi:valyl-tRNA synthetase